MPVSHAALAKLWHEEKYLIDTHTAVAYTVYLDYRERTGDGTKTLIASTASPYKFAGSVAGAIGIEAGADEFRTVENMKEQTGIPVPYSLEALDMLPVLHEDVIDKTAIKSAVADVLIGC
jgi:threonine synthase